MKMKYEGMYRELYAIVTLQTRSERVRAFYEWHMKHKGSEEE